MKTIKTKKLGKLPFCFINGVLQVMEVHQVYIERVIMNQTELNK